MQNYQKPADANRGQYTPNDNNNNSTRNYKKDGYKTEYKNHRNTHFIKPEGTVESFCISAIESKPLRAFEFTSRKQVDKLWKEARTTGYSQFNFALAKCYLDNPAFFSEFFQEDEFLQLLQTDYKSNEYTKFFNNFVLASSLIVDPKNIDQLVHYSKLLATFNNIRKELEKSKTADSNEESYEKQLIVEQTIVILRMIHLKAPNEKYQEFINKFLPNFIESTFNQHKVLQADVLSPSETSLALYYFLFKHQINDPTALASMEGLASRIDLTNQQSAIQFIKGYSYILVSNKDLLNDYGSIINPIFESYMKLLAEKQIADTKDIVSLFYGFGHIDLNVQNKSQIIKNFSLIDKFLNNQVYTPIQLKSLFYSIGKNSFVSENISQFLLKHLQEKSLDQSIQQERADQNVSNLILSSSNLRILTKEGITENLVKQILKVANLPQKNDQNLSRYLLAIGISFLRMGYYGKDFWEPFFKLLPLKYDSYFLQLIFEAAPILYSEMSPEVVALFQDGFQRFQSVEKVEQQQHQDVKITPQDIEVKKYLEDKHISFSEQVIINGIFTNFVLTESKKVILVFSPNHFIVSDNESSTNELNLSSLFKVDILKKNGYQVIILQQQEQDLIQQLTSQL